MKKNRTSLFRDYFIPGRKYLRIMKLTFIFIFLGLMSFASVSYSQATRLSFESKNATIESVFKQIESLSEFKFAYNSTKLDVEKIISLKVDNQTINAILDKILGAADLQYKIVDRYIIITDENSSNSSFLGNSTQQQKSVSGKVTDSSGSSLPGVSVVVKGTTTGTITDANGNYSISNLPANATLQFSFVGMKGQEVAIGGKTTIDITLAEDAIGLDEVVAIGYGTQRKENITGSMETASNEQIENKAIVSVGQALQGEVSGVTIRQTDGKPGSSTDIIIRGSGTFSSAGNNPLVLVDGIPGSLDAVNPNDIRNISILKDAASAAIYGSRAANGVILIQTKRGQTGKTEVSYNGTFGFSELADMPKFVDSWNYARAYNEALTNAGQGAVYSEDDIQKFISGEDHDKYPNDKHYEMAFDNIAFQTKHDISLMGGGASTSYRFSFGYLRNDGLLQNNLYDNYSDNLLNYYNKYSIRLNVDSEITKKLKLIANFSGSTDDEKGPGAATGDGTTM
ncbi:MAG: SusC/RagA family TonB-linked outer membrane protein, partial [Bacteroidota bacterium]|nr:SusC/RagA family TonB-linked outer membrane protein [Bacteroidota bacterium]